MAADITLIQSICCTYVLKLYSFLNCCRIIMLRRLPQPPQQHLSTIGNGKREQSKSFGFIKLHLKYISVIFFFYIYIKFELIFRYKIVYIFGEIFILVAHTTSPRSVTPESSSTPLITITEIVPP